MSREDQEAIGRRVAQARQEAGLSQNELAHRLGMKDARSLRFIESGQRPPYRWVPRISEQTNRPIDWFYGIEADVEIADLRREIAEMRAEIRELLDRRQDDEHPAE